VQNAPFVTYIKDTGGRYLFYNRESKRVFHISGDEFIGKTIHDVYPNAADAAIVDALDRQVVDTGQHVVTELLMPETTELEWAVIVKFPIRDETGRIVGIGGFDIDTTKQKRIERALEQSEAQRRRASGARALWIWCSRPSGFTSAARSCSPTRPPPGCSAPPRRRP
jgi:PAS domain S-box-containing protein